MKRVYKCEYCYLKNARPCYECSACMSGDDHFRPAKPEKKRTTNADSIRAMNDEELAEFLGDWAQRHRAWMCDSQGECLAWLQEPAKDGGNDD